MIEGSGRFRVVWVLGLFRVRDGLRVVLGSGLLQAWLRGFGVVWRFRVVELCSGFSRVVSGCFQWCGVQGGLRLFGVQVCSGFFGLFWVYGRSALSRV